MVMVNAERPVTKKSFTPAQLLCMHKPKKAPEPVVVLDDHKETKHEYKDIIMIDDDADITIVKENILPTPPSSTKKAPVSLAQLLSGNRKQPQEKKTLMVTLKLPPQTTTPKPSLIVSIKYKPPAKLVKQNKVHANSSSHPFFKAVFDKMSAKQAEDKSSKITTPKVFKLPKLDKSEYKITNVTSEEQSYLNHTPTYLHTLSLRQNPKPDLSFTDLDFLLFYSKYKSIHDAEIPHEDTYTVTIDIDIEATELLVQKYSHLKFDDRYNKFFQSDYRHALGGNNIDQWCDIYKPLDHQQNMQKSYISTDVYNWFTESFLKLKRVNQSKRKQKLSKKKQVKELDSFIVYSDEESEDADDSNVPCLIIEGPIGCGKTTMIHSIVEDELGGHVFEFNSNQSRARKDLEFNLKQMGTTTMVNQKQTVILFDDVNLIDDESDKDFWLGVHDLLTFSYRPVVLITDDIKSIPKNIVNESTIYNFSKIENIEIQQYLDMIGLSRNLNMDSKLLDKLSSLDLRKSMMELQMLSYKFDLSNVGLTNVTVIEDDSEVDNIEQSTLEKLNRFHDKLELKYYTSSIDDVPDYREVMDDRFESDCASTIEFYASKYFSNGSRSKMCRYMDAEDYHKKHPANSFAALPRGKMASDIVSVIRVMAQREAERVQTRYPRRFEMDPVDVYDDLFVADV